MPPSFSELLPSLLAIVALALAMVFVMVQWSRAMILSQSSRRISAVPADGWSTARRWGFAYAAAWALLIAAYLRLFDRLGEPRNPRNFALLFLVAGGWLGLNWILILFARAIQRANERDAARLEPEPAWSGTDDKDEEVAAEEDAQAGAAPAPTLSSRLRNGLRTVLAVMVVLVVIGIGEALPPLQRLHSWTVAHQKPLLWIVVPLGAIGFVLFMYCAINLALGGQGDDSASFSEVKQAWRERAWQSSPRWRRVFLWMLATAMLASGILGTIFIIASPGIKLVIGGAYVYAVVRTAVAFSRS